MSKNLTYLCSMQKSMEHLSPSVFHVLFEGHRRPGSGIVSLFVAIII